MYPLNITSSQGNNLNISPSLLEEVRCSHCQMFGHRNKNCNNTVICPHCAGSHTHQQCKNQTNKKCANCNRQHSAAYKGCHTYLTYQNKIKTKNIELNETHNERITKSNKKLEIIKQNKVNQEQVKSAIKAIIPKISSIPLSEIELDTLIEEQIPSQTESIKASIDSCRETHGYIDTSNIESFTPVEIIIKPNPNINKKHLHTKPRKPEETIHHSYPKPPPFMFWPERPEFF